MPLAPSAVEFRSYEINPRFPILFASNSEPADTISTECQDPSMWPIVANRFAESRIAARTSADAVGGEVEKGLLKRTLLDDCMLDVNIRGSALATDVFAPDMIPYP